MSTLQRSVFRLEHIINMGYISGVNLLTAKRRNGINLFSLLFIQKRVLHVSSQQPRMFLPIRTVCTKHCVENNATLKFRNNTVWTLMSGTMCPKSPHIWYDLNPVQNGWKRRNTLSTMKWASLYYDIQNSRVKTQFWRRYKDWQLSV
jgi:hypothetical protein